MMSILAPEKIKVREEMLSPGQLEMKKEHDIKTGSINLLPKKNYVIHYRNLKYYLSKRLILKKVHRILEFEQSAWMKPYIDFNTERRKETTNEADKNLFKKLNNAVYGKTMENMRKRIKVRITTNEKDFIKYASRSTYIGDKKFGKQLVVIHEKKEVLTLNKPIYVGNTVLELSKLEMYKFYVKRKNVKKKKECKICILLFTETDSLCFETDEDFYEIMYKFPEFFDLSNFPKDSKYYCGDNKKVPGKMKDEYGGAAIKKYIELKSKMNSIVDVNECEKNAYKVHNSNIYYDLEDVFCYKKVIGHQMKRMRPKNHKIYTQEIDKISLSSFDDKIYILDYWINTLAFGHQDIPKNE